MRQNISILLVAVLALCVVNAGSVKPADLHPSPVVDSMEVETLCPWNSFDVSVSDCDGNPVAGVTVTLTCPDGSQETRVTNSDGKCCFARGISFSGEPSWPTGYYALTAGCLVKLVYRSSDGDIEVDLSTCCPK